MFTILHHGYSIEIGAASSAGLNDGVHMARHTTAATPDWCWPSELMGDVANVANLDTADAFVNLVSLVSSLRQSGVLLTVEAHQYAAFGIREGSITWCLSNPIVAMLNTSEVDSEPVNQQSTDQTLEQISERLAQLGTHELQRLSLMAEGFTKNHFARLLHPVSGAAFWGSSGPGTHTLELFRLSLEHQLLDSARHVDESSRGQSAASLYSIPADSRIHFDLKQSLDHPVFRSLQGALGVPPYRTADIRDTISDQRLLTLIHQGLNEGVLIIQRVEEKTVPPGTQQLWDANQQYLQTLVARFNHVLRRLLILGGLNRNTLSHQLEIFGQFYGYAELLEGVYHLDDGALTSERLIGNLMRGGQQLSDARIQICEALQDLIFFNLSSARSLDAADRRALMSMTSNIAAHTQQPKQ